MRILITVLVLLLAGLQYRLWIGDGSLAHLASLERDIEAQQQRNDRLGQRNGMLAAQVEELKGGLDAVQARAREQLGMTRKNETFYLLVDQ